MPPSPFARLHSSPYRTLAIRAASLVLWIPALIAVRDHILEPMWIRGPSMYPFLNTDYNSSTASDCVITSKWNPHVGLRRGMIVAFWTPHDPERMAVKRIIALPGDEVLTRAPYPFPRAEILPGQVWVEGEHPGGTGKSLDSNTFGPISMSLIVGQVSAVVWPWERRGLVRWQDWRGSPRVIKDANRYDTVRLGGLSTGGSGEGLG